MGGRYHRPAIRTFAAGIVVLTLGIMGYGLYLIVVGQPWTIVPERPPGGTQDPGTTVVMPALQGVIPLTGGILVLAGILFRKLLVAWVGAILIALFASLFLFGVGGILIPVAAALLTLLAIETWLARR